MSFPQVITFTDLRNLINESYYELRPSLANVLVNAVNFAEEYKEDVEYALYTLILNAVSPAMADSEAIRIYLEDQTTAGSTTRELFERYLEH